MRSEQRVAAETSIIMVKFGDPLWDTPEEIAAREVRKARITTESRELKSSHPTLWESCIQSAAGICANHDLDVKVGADIESDMIHLCLKAIAEEKKS